jgi:Na+/proline symporter
MQTLFLFWTAFAGIILAAIFAPNLLRDSTVPKWRKAIYCFILGPAIWIVIAAALVIASVMFCVHAEKRRRAKKAKP